MNKYKEIRFIASLDEEIRIPDLTIGGFDLWVHGRSCLDADNTWDQNSLDILARCCDSTAIVQVDRSILYLFELHEFMLECKKIYNDLSGEAILECMDSDIAIEIAMQSTGHCKLIVSITPDPLYQKHSFTFNQDQTDLVPFIRSLERIFNTYPLMV